MNRGLLGEEQIRSVQGQIAVNLIGGNLVITGDAVLAAGIHQHLSAQNVGLQEDLGILDGAVNMALSGIPALASAQKTEKHPDDLAAYNGEILRRIAVLAGE